jgi:radical SAM protein (TIGR01212 family)
MKTRSLFNKRYFDFKSYLINQFNEKVYKVTIDAGFSCPNRDGTKGYGGCIYCNSKGSRYRENNKLTVPIETQIKLGKDFYKKTQNAKKFLAYFQTYTNTYANIETLKKIYQIPLNDPEIVGLSIGTRPDCVDIEKIELIESFLKYKKEIWIEYGLQSIHENTLKFINRGHTLNEFENAIEITKNRGIKICVHIIVGLPYEDKDMILETAKYVAKLPIDGIKIHSLMLLKGTLMEKIYNKNPFPFLTLEEYVNIVADIIEILPENMIIQRLTGDGYRDIFIAPEWCKNKLKVLNLIEKELERRGTYQGIKGG